MEKIDTDIILPTLKMFNVTKKGRHYTLPNGEDVPSVTNVQGILDKPALMWWAANVERDMVIERAAQFFTDCDGQLQGPKHAIVTMLRNYVPKQQARFRVSKEATDIGSETHALIQWRCKEMLGTVRGAPPKASKAPAAESCW